jgi:SAM-dependent methyltransferase
MDLKEYEIMFAAEDGHWWYRGMQQITISVLDRLYTEPRDLQILDAGCGTGGAMKYLSAYGRVTGCDLVPLGLEFCRRRALSRLGQASVTSLPFRDGAFDLVTSFDVLYHRGVRDHHAALSEFWRLLRPGGRLLLRLPAYDWLRRHHDQVTHTGLRFSATALRRDLTRAGFFVEKLTYANTFSLPVAICKSMIERYLPPKGESVLGHSPAWQDRLFSQLLFLEARWLRAHSLPFGLSVVGAGRKPKVEMSSSRGKS